MPVRETVVNATDMTKAEYLVFACLEGLVCRTRVVAFCTAIRPKYVLRFPPEIFSGTPQLLISGIAFQRSGVPVDDEPLLLTTVLAHTMQP